MYLDKPLFPLKPDESARQYANVSNSLEVANGSKVRYVPIQVNACLFPLMRHFGVAYGAEVTLYLDTEGDRCIFGFCVNGGQIFDLWPYAKKLLPPFIQEAL